MALRRGMGQIGVNPAQDVPGLHRRRPMTYLTRAAALLALSFAFAAPMAHAENDGAIDPATEATVTAALTAQGYEVRKVTSEDGMIEVYAIKDGQTAELYVDATGKIIKSN
jgi:hypothetical protein